jgi:radical SAM protein with 4Fe4S-binding SPASM domain
MEYSQLKANQLYPISLEVEEESSFTYLLYAPLKGLVYLVSELQLRFLEENLFKDKVFSDEYMEKIQKILISKTEKPLFSTKSIDDIQNLMLLPNNICNFKCSYCYAAEGRSNKVIDLEKLKLGIKYFFDPGRAKGKRLTISVLGGGEPLLSWFLIKSTLEYALLLNKERGYTNLPISIVTNGSILNDDIIDFCKTNNVSVSVTFEILKEIQNLQRGSYEKVVENINTLTAQGVEVALNSVITKNNVHLMPEMIKEASLIISDVKKMAFNPIMDSDYFDSFEDSALFYKNYIEGFYAAFKLAKEKGIYLTCTFLNAFYCVTDRYCPGKFVITSEGTVSICYFVSSSRDKLYQSFIYGDIKEDDEIVIDEEKFQAIINNSGKTEECDKCYAKWHCSGGCFVNNRLFTIENKKIYCQTMRDFLKRMLLEKIDSGINEF